MKDKPKSFFNTKNVFHTKAMLLITTFALSGSHKGLVIYLPLTLMRAVWLEQQQLFPEHGGWKQLLFQQAKSSEKDRKPEKNFPLHVWKEERFVAYAFSASF